MDFTQFGYGRTNQRKIPALNENKNHTRIKTTATHTPYQSTTKVTYLKLKCKIEKRKQQNNEHRSKQQQQQQAIATKTALAALVL